MTATSSSTRRPLSPDAARGGRRRRAPSASSPRRCRSAPAPDAAWIRRIGWAAPLAGAAVGLVGAAGLRRRPRSACLRCWPRPSRSRVDARERRLARGGLADVADGFGGGGDRECKLAILRDSRIGAYGAVALVFSLLVRVGALAAMIHRSSAFAAAALILAGAARAGALVPLGWLAPARADGAGASAGRRPAQDGPAAAGASARRARAGLARARNRADAIRFRARRAGAAGHRGLAPRQIGGQTGDVGGAPQQGAEIAAVLALLIGGRSLKSGR